MPPRSRRRATQTSKPRRRKAIVSTTFHAFPPEILLRIFNYAAAASQAASVALCLVSSWTRRLALPHLFSSAIIRDANQVRPFANAVGTTIHLQDGAIWNPREVVQGMWMHSSKANPVTYIPSSLVQNCPLGHIAVDDRGLANLLNYSSLEYYGKKIHRVTVTGKATNWGDVVLRLQLLQLHHEPALEGVTHVHFLSAHNYGSQLNLSGFPDLTHLAIPIANCGDPFPSFNMILISKPVLQMLVLVLYPKYKQGIVGRFDVTGWVRETRKTDSRVFMLEYSSRRVKEDWRMEVRDGDGMWERAIAFTKNWEASDFE